VCVCVCVCVCVLASLVWEAWKTVDARDG